MPFNPYQAQLDAVKQQLADNQALLNDPELKELAELEIAELTSQLQQLEEASASFGDSGESSSSDETPTFTNCMLEVRQGAGGDEAKIWGSDLLRMYLRFVEQVGLKVEILDDLVIKIKGKITDPELIKSLTQNPDTDAAKAAALPTVLFPYELFKFESGVHRVQRVPATEAQGRIHTSTASVAVIPEVKKTAVDINEGDLQWEFMRAGGAGGQNVNKVNSAVRLTHIPTGLVASSRQERTQVQNREIALDLLRGQLWEIQEEQRLSALGKARSAIGRNMRAEKIRTFNYPQNRVTDHRINQSWYNLENIVNGDLVTVFREVRLGLATLEAEATASETSTEKTA